MKYISDKCSGLSLSASAVRTSAARGQRNCAFSAPSQSQAVADSLQVNAGSIRPSSQALRLVADGQRLGVSPIVRLLGLTRPANVTGFVMSVVIRKAIDRMLWGWLRPEFGKEVLERFEAKFDASATVIFVGVMIFVVTSLLGVFVRAIFGRAALAVSMCSDFFAVKTTAGFRYAALEAVALDAAIRAATTPTNPVGALAAIFTGVSQYGQATVHVAG